MIQTQFVVAHISSQSSGSKHLSLQRNRLSQVTFQLEACRLKIS